MSMNHAECKLVVVSSIAVLIEVRYSIQHSLPGGFLIDRKCRIVHSADVLHEPFCRVDQREDELVILAVIDSKVVFCFVKRDHEPDLTLSVLTASGRMSLPSRRSIARKPT